FGDGAADVMPLSGLTKRQVRAIAEALGAPAELVKKTPTADLENLAPGRPDEDALGVSYDALDDFLEGRPVSEEVFRTVLGHYRRTEHKRNLPVVPPVV
ncbi:NAD(+) synthase, partial [Kitasatospora sp. NPDC057512]|uniref:NAD(+) synthase n=1 Tax=Kitasatospora sp. NPDC057512 TaxID=3346154 RepID=UPI0036AFEFD5